GAFVVGFGEGVDVASSFREGVGLQTKLGIAERVGHVVAEKGASLQGTATEFERERIGASGEIQLGDFKDAARRSLHFAAGGAGGAGQALHFKAAAVRNGVALGFFDQNDDVLVGIGATGILRGNGDAVKNAEIVKAALGIDDLAFAQGLSGLDLDLAVNHVWPGVVVSSDEDTAHVRARPLVDLIDNPD